MSTLAMFIDISSVGAASELLQQTASTSRVREAVELSLAPAFLLVGIGGLLHVMMQRLVNELLNGAHKDLPACSSCGQTTALFVLSG